MTDRRLTPANGRVAAVELKGQVTAEHFVAGVWQAAARPVVDLLDAPGGRRDRQLLFGETFRVLEDHDGHAFGQARRDGHVGYIAVVDLKPVIDCTHFVATPATHAYPGPDFKAHEDMALPFGARFRVVSASGRFFETEEGLFVPKPHLRPLNAAMRDPATVAQLFFGSPYLWGGNSTRGVDCSGLVQAAHLACHIDCPGDSDLQQSALGTELPQGTAPRRGDLFFWPGHVAIAVDAEILIHANAYHMAVAYEPIRDAIARIEDQGDGPLTAHKRL